MAIPDTVLTSLLLRHYQQVASGQYTHPSLVSCLVHACALFLFFVEPESNTLSTLHECNIDILMILSRSQYLCKAFHICPSGGFLLSSSSFRLSLDINVIQRYRKTVLRNIVAKVCSHPLWSRVKNFGDCCDRGHRCAHAMEALCHRGKASSETRLVVPTTFLAKFTS